MLTLDSFLPKEEECLNTLREIRWSNGVTCLSCSSKNVIKYGRYGIYQKYRRENCGSVFNDKGGTIFHRSRMPLRMVLHSLHDSIQGIHS
ncbi:MAG: transposase [Nitrososphaerales archaeon]